MAETTPSISEQEPIEEGRQDGLPEEQLQPVAAAEPPGGSEPVIVSEPAVAGRRVGGRRWRRLAVIGGVGAGGILVLAALGLLGLQLVVTASAGLEPSSTQRFMSALNRHDPAGMRAQVTSTCVGDQNSALCFNADADNQFKQFMANRKATTTFLRRFNGKMGTVALYDLYLKSSTGQQQEFVLTFKLAADGRIDHVLAN